MGTQMRTWVCRVLGGMRQPGGGPSVLGRALLVAAIAGGLACWGPFASGPIAEVHGADELQFAPASATCTNRPRVGVSLTREGNGLRGTLTAAPSSEVPNNRLQQLRVGTSTNGAIDARAQTLTSSGSLALPDRPQSLSLFVRRISGSGAVTVPLTVVDDCGEWKTLVGGGAEMFESSSPTTTPTATAVKPVPVAGQPCPAWVHDQYMAAGPDGQSYPTWHPPTDPTSGCWFGHEHGDDPTGAPALRGRSVVFGYAGARAAMDEPHAGFKVFRWDNIHHPNAPNHEGAFLVMVVHMGTSGEARFTTTHHSVTFDYYNPRDGREVHTQVMAPFGTLLVGCGANDPNMALRVQQANAPGARQITADACFNSPSSPYEDWITSMYIGSDTSGNWRAYIDPHFAAFNPNTYCVPDGTPCQLAHSDDRAHTGDDPLGPDSSFKGTHREAYLNQVWVDNAGNGTTVWTDPFGRLTSQNAPNAIPQYICSLDTRPQGNSAVFGSDRQYDDGSVRAPN